jgi:hypothetical protein
MKVFVKSVAIAVILLTSLPLSAYSYINQSQERVINNQIAQKSGTIAYSKIGIGGINLSMSEANVKKILGKPIKVKNSDSPAVGKVRNLTYKDISIDLVEDVNKKGIYSVFKVNTKSSKYLTPNSIRVGDTYAKVIKIYGKTTESKQGKTILLGYQGNLKDAPAALIFKIENGKVVEIFAVEQLT